MIRTRDLHKCRSKEVITKQHDLATKQLTLKKQYITHVLQSHKQYITQVLQLHQLNLLTYNLLEKIIST